MNISGGKSSEQTFKSKNYENSCEKGYKRIRVVSKSFEQKLWAKGVKKCWTKVETKSVNKSC